MSRGAARSACRRQIASGIAICAASLAWWPCHSLAAEGDASSTTQARSIESGGLKRSYRLHAAKQIDPEQAAPLVLVFHGGGGTPEQIERESRFSELADREGFVVAYPTGHRRSWNDGRGADAVAAQRDGVDDVAFAAAVIDDVSALRRIDPKRVYATGISNGAMFSHRLAIGLSSRVAAIAPVAGGLPQPLAASFDPRASVSVLIVNGTLDPLVPYDGGEVRVLASSRGRVAGARETARLWSVHDGCGTTPLVEQATDEGGAGVCTMTRISYPSCGHGTDVVLLQLGGGGHTWPGGSQYLPERLVGKVCRDIDATALIWDFFKHHPKP